MWTLEVVGTLPPAATGTHRSWPPAVLSTHRASPPTLPSLSPYLQCSSPSFALRRAAPPPIALLENPTVLLIRSR